LQLANSMDAVPITRDYLARREQRLRAIESTPETMQVVS
jgi:hypothetical protein